MVAVIGGVRARGASGVVSVHALVSTAAHAIAQHDLLVSISRLRRRGEGPCRVAAKSEPERGQGLYSPRLWYAHRSGSEPAQRRRMQAEPWRCCIATVVVADVYSLRERASLA